MKTCLLDAGTKLRAVFVFVADGWLRRGCGRKGRRQRGYWNRQEDGKEVVEVISSIKPHHGYEN